MGKIVLSPEAKKKIAEVTGLTYLAYNLEKYEDTDGKYVAQILNYYAPTIEQLDQVKTEVIPVIKEENPNFDPDGGEPTPTQQYKFVIVAVPEGAKILINGVEQSAITVDEGSVVSYEVSADGYVTQTGNVTVDKDITKEITLVEATPDNATLTVNPTPAEAEVKINGEIQNQITVAVGTEVTVEVSHPGYKPYSVTLTITETIELPVVLEEKAKPGFQSTLPDSLVAGVPVEYEVSTTPGDYTGEMIFVKGAVTNKDNISLEYWEPNEKEPSYHNMPTNEQGEFYFGTPSVGFPLSEATSKFRVTAQAGEYDITMNIVSVATGEILATTSTHVTVAEPEKVKPTITSTLPQTITVGQEVEYESSTTPGDYAGEMVYMKASVTNKELVAISYWEPNEEVPSYHELPLDEGGNFIFGVPSVGFPLAEATSKFKVTANAAGTFNVHTEIISVASGEVIASVDGSCEAKAAAKTRTTKK